MTNIVIVTKVDTAKSGAPRVYFDNKHDWADAYYVSRRIDLPEVGATIDADTSSSDFKGKTYWYLNKFKVVTRSSPEAPKTASNGRIAANGVPSQPKHLYTSDDPATNLKAVEAVNDALHAKLKLQASGWSLDSKDCAIILEVILKAAFDKGLINAPEDMATWIERTYRYVEGLKSGKPIALDEPLPSFGSPAPGGLEGPIDEGEPDF